VLRLVELTMNSTCHFISLFSAVVATLLFAGCVDLTPPWAGQQNAVDQGGDPASPDNPTGGGGGSTALGPDATAVGASSAPGPDAASADTARGGLGGSAATGGTVTGGTASGGAAGLVATGGAGGLAARGGTTAATTGGTSGTGMGGAAGDVAPDAGAASPTDGLIDVALSADVSPPSDRASGGSDGAGTGGAGGSGGTGAGGAIVPMIISIDFVGGRTGGSPGIPAMTPSETAGVKRATHWNSALEREGTLTSLASADGSTTSGSVTWNSPLVTGEPAAIWYVGFTDSSGDSHMMNGYLDPRSAASPATVDVTLPGSMSGGYDVYVYCYANIKATASDTRTYQYTIGSTTHFAVQAGASASTFPGYTLAPDVEAGAPDAGGASEGDYVVFRNLSGTSFQLTARPVGSINGVERAPVNGIQIVDPSGS